MPNTDQPVLFIQGGGEGAYDCDAKLAASLETRLGRGYPVAYPRMPNEADPSYAAWRRQILEELGRLGQPVVLVAHSIGASMVMKMLADGDIGPALRGVFIIAAPYLHAREGWQWNEAELPANAAARLPKHLPVCLYHGDADEVVPFEHLALYTKALPRVIARALPGRDHQVREDLTEIADDIRKL
jgi:uncharacterized protein